MDDKDEEIDELIDEKEDEGDDDMLDDIEAPKKPETPQAPEKSLTREEIKKTLTAVVEEVRKRVFAVRAYSEAEIKMIDVALGVFNSDAAVGMAEASKRSLKEITEGLYEELGDFESAFKACAPPPAPVPAPAPTPAPPQSPAARKAAQKAKKGFFEDTAEKTEGPAGPACDVCKTLGSVAPLMMVGTKWYCMAHVQEAGVAPPPGVPLPKPPQIPWHIHKLSQFDAIRKKIEGTTTLLQIIAGEGEDEVQMTAHDRIVVMLVKVDGTKHKVFDKMAGTAQLYLFNFSLTSWGPSTLSPGQMRTPQGYR